MGLMRAGAIALTGFSILLYGAASNASGPPSRLQKDNNSVEERAASILRVNCIKCHDSVKRTGGIDLTSRAVAVAASALNDREPMKGELLREVTEGRMPPTGKLPTESIELLRQWILKGAPYPTEKLTAINPAMMPLWSFQPVRPQRVPRTPFDKLAQNPIDSFVFDRLATNRLAPSPRADKLTLLRRVTIDLTGLAPAPKEISAFLGDRSPKAYENVVDRLLASPAYGERWARHWLDVVRYGESDGYERNIIRPNAWPYRDYVIRAFNQDLPYTQFVTEQLAGDTVGKGDPNVEAATGFLVAGIHDTVGNATEEGTRQQRISDLEDITSTAGAAFLALTVGCARCHDHKFDPIPQRDFYRLAAVFAGVRFGERPIISGPALRKALLESADIARKAFQTINALNELDDSARQRVLSMPSEAAPVASENLRPAVNARRNVDTFPAVFGRYVRFTVLATRDGAEPCLDELQVYGPGSHEDLALATNGAVATASGLLPGFDAHTIPHLNDGRFGNEYSWIGNVRGSGWAQVALPTARMLNRVVWSRDGAEIPRFDDRFPTRYRIEVSEDGNSWQTVSTEAGRSAHEGRDYVHPDALMKAMTRDERARRAELQATQSELRRKSESLAALYTAYAGQFTTPDPMFVLRRGDVMQRGDPVTPGALSQVETLPCDLLPAAEEMRTFSQTVGPSAPVRKLTDAPQGGGEFGLGGNSKLGGVLRLRTKQPEKTAQGLSAGSDPDAVSANSPNVTSKTEPPESARRIALAHWIGNNKNPLAARVIVNRIWQYHFGRGIVGTPSDFGRNGEKPSHPELLDWLANDFMSHGWRMKRLHKMILMSTTYCQSGAVSTSGLKLDAGNRFLWHMPLQRMEAESLRDTILETSGKLDRRMGGPGFQLFKYSELNVASYDPLDQYSPETWRRSVYRASARAIRDDLLETFDCPESAQREPRRATTTTALQALSLLNGAFLVQQSGFFADRVQREAGANRKAQVNLAFQLAFGRLPRSDECRAGLRLADDQGLPTLCRALMNANEFLYY